MQAAAAWAVDWATSAGQAVTAIELNMNRQPAACLHPGAPCTAECRPSQLCQANQHPPFHQLPRNRCSPKMLSGSASCFLLSAVFSTSHSATCTTTAKQSVCVGKPAWHCLHSWVQRLLVLQSLATHTAGHMRQLPVLQDHHPTADISIAVSAVSAARSI